MRIENLRYDILSKGEDQPERFIEEGEVIYLIVKERNVQTTDDSSINEAEIISEYSDRLGKFNHILGRGKVDDDFEPCEVYYDIENSCEKGTVIGELTLKKRVS